jgi:hypothetical protein
LEKAVSQKTGASAAYVDEYWGSLSDQQLLAIQWETHDPLSLPNVQAWIPENIGEFQVELSYDLSRSDPPVPCAHCPQHQPHWHGFVVIDELGRRYLLGSHCGPSAYGSDYRLASNARAEAKRRFDALSRWLALRAELPDLMKALAAAEREPSFGAVRRVRGTFENRAPGMLRALRARHPDSLTGQIPLQVETVQRDQAEEERRALAFQSAIRDIVDLPNREHARRISEIKRQTGYGQEVNRRDLKEFGVLQGHGWLLPAYNPMKEVPGIIARLRGYLAIGATTQDKKRSQIEKISRAAEADLDLAGVALLTIQKAGEFFEAQHLTRLSDWASLSLKQSGEMRADGAALSVRDRGGDYVDLTLGVGWNPPGEDFLAMRRTSLAREYRPSLR